MSANKIWRPRRGATSVMQTEGKGSIVLANGEFFVEMPNTGAGTEGNYKIKIGDGVSPYKDLPYAFNDDIAEKTVSVSDNTETDIDTILDTIVTGKDLSTVLGSFKAAVSSLRDENEKIELAFQDGCNTIVSGITSYGVTPASNSPADIVDSLSSIYNAGFKGDASASDVLEGKTFTNSSSNSNIGTMKSYNSSNTNTIICNSTNGTVNYSLPAGYYTAINVNQANLYDAAYTAGYNAGYSVGYEAGNGKTTSNVIREVTKQVYPAKVSSGKLMKSNKNYEWYSRTISGVGTGTINVDFGKKILGNPLVNHVSIDSRSVTSSGGITITYNSIGGAPRTTLLGINGSVATYRYEITFTGNIETKESKSTGGSISYLLHFILRAVAVVEN